MKLVGNKKGIHSPEFHRKKERQRKIRLVAITLAILIVIIGPILIFRNKRLLISDIQVQGNQVTASADIEDIVTGDLSGNYLWVIPKSSAFFYQKTKIKSDILKNLPRVSAVEVSLSAFHALTVTVAERTPSALYCTNTTDIENPTDCYFIDSTGYIFSSAPAISGGVYMVYTSDPALTAPLKTSFMPAQQFQKLSDFIANLAHIPLEPKIFVQKVDEDDLLLPDGTTIMWTPTQDLDTVYSNLSTFLNDPSQSKTPLNNLLYIDLRFKDKVFYKYKS
jgi:cell division septal protein FtsQ